MQRAFHILSLSAALVALNACSSHSIRSNGALGPYDSQGNYIEAWADDPSKWRYPPGGSGGNLNVPSGNVTPLPGRGSPAVILPPSKPVKAAPPKVAPAPTPPRVVSTPAPRPTAGTTKTTARPAPKTTARPVQKTTAKPKPKTTVKPKPKATVKAKPKPKPAATKTVTIQKGDSLSKLAARHGTTVSEIKRANNLKGDLIITGKSLKIPPKKR